MCDTAFSTSESINASILYQAYEQAVETLVICCVSVSGLLTEAVMQIGSDENHLAETF